jgi:hypothetical protein
MSRPTEPGALHAIGPRLGTRPDHKNDSDADGKQPDADSGVLRFRSPPNANRARASHAISDAHWHTAGRIEFFVVRMWYRAPNRIAKPDEIMRPQAPNQRVLLERTTGFEPATLTLAKKQTQLAYLHLRKLTQHDRQFRLTTMNSE